MLNKVAAGDSGSQKVNLQWVAQDYQNLSGKVALDALQDATDGVDVMNSVRGLRGSETEHQPASDKAASTTQEVVNDGVARTQEMVHESQEQHQEQHQKEHEQKQQKKAEHQQQQKPKPAPPPDARTRREQKK